MPIQRAVDVQHLTLAVRVWPAEGPTERPLVLLPATGETAEDWDVVAAATSRRRTTYAVDLRGHGASDWPGTYSIELLAEDVVSLLPHLGDSAVDLVGHSLGGLVAVAVAAARPELVHRLVLEDVGLLHARPPNPPERPDGDLPFDWRVVEQVRPEVDDPDPAWAQVAARVRAPTLVIAGGPRSPVPAEHIDELVDLLPHGRLVTLDTGHLVHATEPDEFLRHLLAFLLLLEEEEPGDGGGDPTLDAGPLPPSPPRPLPGTTKEG